MFRPARLSASIGLSAHEVVSRGRSIALRRLLGAVIGLALALSACSSTPPASTNRTSTSVPSASVAADDASPSASEAVYDGELGDIVFNRNLVLFTIYADGSHEQLIHESWDGIGLSKDGTTFFSPATAANGRLLPLVLPADGSGEYWLPVVDPTLQLGGGDWSPDGTRLLVEAWDDTDASRRGIYSLSLDGGDLVRLTNAGHRANIPAYTGAYSPDGERVLFFSPVAEEEGDAGSMNLFVVNADGTGLVQLNPSDTQAGLVGPSGASDWSPDSTQVAFVASDGDFWGANRRAVFVVNADGSDPVRITEWGDILTVQWSPDGQLLAMTTAGPTGTREIVTVRPDGSNLMPVTSSEDGTFSFGAMWSPDGSQLLFIRGTDLRSQMDLWIVNADGTNAVQVASSVAYGYDWVPR
jgi:Tol biopolymer transport system component